jgi:putative methionine-R-sulfoxide reductase with GAF domain
MSVQQSTSFNNNNIKQNKLSELVKLTEQLLIQPNFESLVTCLIGTLERIYSCNIKLWLTDQYRTLILNEVFLNSSTFVSSKTELMIQAFNARCVVSDVENTIKKRGLCNIIVVPLMYKEEILGMIQLELLNQKGIDNQDIKFISDICLQTSVLMDHHLKEEICSYQQEKISTLTLLAQINKSIYSILDLPNLLNSVVTLLHQKLGFDNVGIYIIKDQNKEKFGKVSISERGLETIPLYDIKNDNSPVSLAIINSKTVVIKNPESDNRFTSSFWNSNCKSELVVPLISGEAFYGVLDLCSDNVDSFNPHYVQTIESLAENIALAIRNATLYRDEHQTRHITERLQNIIGKLSVDISYNELLNKVLIELEKILPSDASAIWLYDDVSTNFGMEQFPSSFRLANVKIHDQSNIDGNQIIFQNIDEIKERLLVYE